jgi:hypothetical protein
VSVALAYSTRTIKIYSGAYDATARADIADHQADHANPHAVTAAQVGLALVDNTADADKPLSGPQAAALALKAAIASPALTGTPSAPTAVLGTATTQLATTEFVASAINALPTENTADDLALHLADHANPHLVTKAQVGLDAADNTSDATKPVSGPQQAAINAANSNIATVAGELDLHEANTANPHSVTKAQLGLGSVDNTSDANKPVSAAQQTAINVASAAAAAAQSDIDGHEANLANPHGTTKAQVGLGAVDNTADLAKPVSTATQTALNTVSASVTTVSGNLTAHTGNTSNPHGTTKAQLGLGSVDNTADANKPVSGPQQTAINAVAASATAAQADINGHKADHANPHVTTKAQVGLANADNTSDLAKPVSTATQSAINTVSGNLAAHTGNVANPHGVTKAQVGLGSVDNTSDAAKPISSATAAALAAKAPLASPALTGTPTAPTAPAGTATTQIATTAFAAAAAADALDAATAATPPRPGDDVEAFGETKTGPASAVVPIDPSWVVDSPAGAVIRVDSGVMTSGAQAIETGDDHIVTTTSAAPILTAAGSLTQTVATRAAYPIEPGRAYTLRWKVQRQVDPIDPLNDAVVLGVQWLDAAKGPVGTTPIAILALQVTDGVVERGIMAALPPQALADVLAPPGSVYFRPYVDLYGDSHVTDIIVLSAQEMSGFFVANGPLFLPVLDADPVGAPGAGIIALYGLRTAAGGATLRMQAGTDPVPMDIILNVGAGA